MPIPVAARSKAWVCGCSRFGIASPNPAGRHGCLPVVSVVYCKIDISVPGRSLVQRSPTERGVCQCERKTSIMRRLWHTRGCCTMGKEIIPKYVFCC